MPLKYSRAGCAAGMGRKKFTCNINAALHRTLKLEAAVQECQMVELVEKALCAYFRILELEKLGDLQRQASDPSSASPEAKKQCS